MRAQFTVVILDLICKAKDFIITQSKLQFRFHLIETMEEEMADRDMCWLNFELQLYMFLQSASFTDLSW